MYVLRIHLGIFLNLLQWFRSGKSSHLTFNNLLQKKSQWRIPVNGNWKIWAVCLICSVSVIYKTSILVWKIHETNVFCNLEQVTELPSLWLNFCHMILENTMAVVSDVTVLLPLISFLLPITALLTIGFMGLGWHTRLWWGVAAVMLLLLCGLTGSFRRCSCVFTPIPSFCLLNIGINISKVITKAY